MKSSAIKLRVSLAATFTAALTLLIAVCVVMPHTAEAATPSLKTMCHVYKEGSGTASKTIKKYDVTNDKKKDTVKVKLASGENAFTLSVYINGKRALKTTAGTNWDAYCGLDLITLKNGKHYLYLYAGGGSDDGGLFGVYRYSKGKLKSIVNSRDAGNGFTSTWVIPYSANNKLKVSGNTVKVTFAGCSYRMGYVNWSYTLKYKKGTLKRTGKAANSCKLDRSYVTAAHNIKAKTSASNKAKNKTLKKNTQVKLTKVIAKDKTMWFKVKTKSGQAYWIKNLAKYCDKGTSTCFKEQMLAG